MLPILSTIAAGLVWLAGTLGYLLIWGFGISIGFWVGKMFTSAMDGYWHQRLANKTFNRLKLKLFNRDKIAAAAVASP